MGLSSTDLPEAKRRHFSSGAALPPHTELGMPALSPTMSQGNIARWLKKEGDAIVAGDLLCEIETDKATLEYECQEEGFLAKIILPQGSKDITVGKPICIITPEKADVPKFASYQPSGKAAAAPSPAPAPKKSESAASASSAAAPLTPPPSPAASAPAPAAAAAGATASASSGPISASPLAKTLAQSLGLDLALIRGTGPDNRIIAADIADYQAQHPQRAAPAHAASTEQVVPTLAGPDGNAFTDVPLSNMRRVIAQRLTMSKQTIPHFYATVDVNLDALLKLRASLNAHAGKDSWKLSINDFVIKAASLACMKFPETRSQWGESSVRVFESVDMCVAVDTGSGLITPFIKNAQSKGLVAISTEMKDLAARAKQNKLKPHEYQGGTFTISNLGMYGVKEFKAIINPPQSCILAVGMGEKRIVSVGGSGDQVVPDAVQWKESTVMSVTLSADHRVVDGAVGAKWLADFKKSIEEPTTMLL
eukprot:TRINITY_DN783_c0_g1_i1.p1 TRINITY_DN783_c0_g1~~TRINITY_DN783_c0_g1_i1.p1  ORF type:complete len:549 (-),score=133.33 TRINITY_DN783_c0_g1_i1:19-1455(-)